MRRDPALASLSRDHHEALVVAQQLQRATLETAADARTRFLTFWQRHGRAHFRAEEEVLLPAYAAHGDPYHSLVARTLCDHVAIRHRAAALAQGPVAAVDGMRDLGVLLAEHVRREERELFPLIEDAMPAAQLAALAAVLEAPVST
jgi:hemerythrin-like domain-containing protein